MSEQLDITQIISCLLKAENILLLCHKNPDGDTIGSAAALCHALEKLGKKSAVICSDEIPARYAYMQIPVFDNQFEPAYIAAIDVAGIQLLGDSISEYTRHIDMCIDHHPSNCGYADVMLLDGTAAATAEIIYDLICAMGVEINSLIANCLYTGLATDTGCFKFANTTSRTHETAARLIENGADVVKLNNLLFESKSREQLNIERIALENISYYYDNRCAVMVLTKDQIAESGAAPADLEGITAIPRTIEGVKVGVTMRQQPAGSYKVSVRTEVGVNASDICKHLGGGGHTQAAGCEILGSLENARGALLAEIEKALAVEETQDVQ